MFWSDASLWGLALSLPADTGYPDPRGELDPEADPGLLYAGQWQDAESGLDVYKRQIFMFWITAAG